MLLLVVAIAYCWRNESGHTGLNPLSTIYLFTPVFLLGVAGVVLAREAARPAIALTVIGLFGMVFGVFVSKLNILNEYQNWISSGMPDRNPGTEALLIAFFVATVGFALIAARLTTKPAEQDADVQAAAAVE